MRTRILSTAVLAIVGVNASLAAQTTTRPTPERDEPRIMTRTLRSAMPDDPDRPRLGLTLAAGGAIDTLGILVDEITAGGPADKAGIKAGDRIVSINGV
ncbi:MAG TPA: PDZ domain-containing protein, partial [Gemmatimonadaceae bacterium]|nr:PDZ domain-containing protein [Gemmatimonadaceae bacterium]